MIAVAKPEWLQTNIDLNPLNTMGLCSYARYFTEVHNLDELQVALNWALTEKVQVFPLGGGSNIVLSGDYDGLVILIRIAGFEILDSNLDSNLNSNDANEVLIKAGAGEDWHQFVRSTIKHGCYGLENLSLIPGCVGAAPIQNIGAYGIEIKDIFHSLEAVDIKTGEVQSLSAKECEFGYRDSVFKGRLRDRFVITSVTFALNKEFTPGLGYGHLQQEVMKAAEEKELTALLVSDVVCRIRDAKLPDPEKVGNAGSFFKNPVVSEEHYQKILAQEPDLVGYSTGTGTWKLAAGWLIDQCGFRGLNQGCAGAGVYEHQALVLVNRGGATGNDILALAEDIQDKVKQRFIVDLEMEPRVY